MSREKKIKEFIQTNMLSRHASRKISDTDSLVESGIIDSLGILKLITFLEEELNIPIESENLVAENFETIQAIIDFTNRGPAPGAGK